MLGDKVHNWQKIILLNTVAASFSAQNHKGIMECEVYFEDDTIMLIEIYRN